ncbi:DUF7687 domain-containing protein [Actinokineospora spheciospongiae]|uniref:DUF7687 domain-containing protein n=1 Tax=Actinokineospora spheciospongiae TaxID=909613 RepID=UPI001268D2A7|nr:hypothetical protein [Actinokineospora spheciospongiae]
MDVYKRKIPSREDILSSRQALGGQKSPGLDAYIRGREHLVEPLVEYLHLRAELASDLLARMRTEDEAKMDLSRLFGVEALTYGTKMTGHHQSAKVLVATVEAMTNQVCGQYGRTVNVNPQQRATVIADDHLWVSPRRLDGAFPGLANPKALWEIKEYWGKTSGGSKMSDAIYECQLVGIELRAFEDKYGVHVEHHVILDGRDQWTARQSDLRRAVDLLYCGLIDELVVGRDVLTDWPRIMESLCAQHVPRSAHHPHAGRRQ